MHNATFEDVLGARRVHPADSVSARSPLFLPPKVPMRLALSPLLLLSGFAGLAYEVVWMRALRLVFGQGPDAIATLLAVFLLGLALGATVIGRLADRRRLDPLRAYGLLELLVAVTALAIPFGLPMLTSWAQSSGAALSMPGRFSRSLISAVVLLPPTFLMGGTLPVLSRLVPSGGSGYRRLITWIYGVNTLGAAAGALVATIWWLPSLGLRTSLQLFPLLNVLSGTGALLLSMSATWRSTRSIIPAPDNATASPATGSSRCETPLLWALALASGFLILMLEIAFTRLYALLLGQSSYAFGLVVTAFVGGLGLASLIASRLLRGRFEPRLLLGSALMAAGLVLAMTIWLSQEVSLRAASAAWGFAGRSLSGGFLVQFASGLAVVFLPTLTLGLVFPVVLAWLSSNTERRATRVGGAYALNTAGSVAGATGGALLIVPLLGPNGTIMAASIAVSVIGCALLLRIPRRRPSWYGSFIGALGVASVLLAATRSDLQPEFVLRSPAIYGHSPDQLASLRAARSGLNAMDVELLYARNDAVATVAAGRGTGQADQSVFFSVNGKVDGSNMLVDMMNQVRTADWALLFLGPRERIERALVIGLGTGITAAEALRYDIERLDVVEISDAVVDVSRRFFARETGSILENPRLHLIRGDGRQFVATTSDRYATIISEPSNPWVAGMGFLFTEDFFRAMRTKLEPDGVLAQWIQTYGLDEPLFRSVVAAFQAVFPRCYLVATYPYGWDMILIGCPGDRPAPPPLEAVLRLTERRAPADPLEPFSLRSQSDLFFGLLAGPDALERYSRDVPHNTDDNGLVEFVAPKLQLARPGGLGVEHYDRLYDVLEPADSLLTAENPPRALVEEARARQLDAMVWMRLGESLERVFAMADALSEDAHQALTRFARAALDDPKRRCAYAYLLAGVLHEYTAGSHASGAPGMGSEKVPVRVPFGPGFRPEPARDLLRSALELFPDSPLTRMVLAVNLEFSPSGVRYGAGAALDEAESLYRDLLEKAPSDRSAARNLAVLACRRARWEEAESVLRHSIDLLGEAPDLEGTLALALINQKKFGEAVTVGRRAVSGEPRDPLLHMVLARALMGADQRDEALVQARVALDLAPSDPEARALVGSLEHARDTHESVRDG